MSNIEENLAFILSSRYGEDVRQAIHDAIHDCYEDGRAGATDLVAREQIANLVANEGSTNKDSELVDTRVDFNGNTFSSAGDSIRNQSKINFLKEASFRLKNLEEAVSLSWNVGFVDKNGGIETTLSIYRYASIPYTAQEAYILYDSFYYKAIQPYVMKGNSGKVYYYNGFSNASDETRYLLDCIPMIFPEDGTLYINGIYNKSSNKKIPVLKKYIDRNSFGDEKIPDLSKKLLEMATRLFPNNGDNISLPFTAGNGYIDTAGNIAGQGVSEYQHVKIPYKANKQYILYDSFYYKAIQPYVMKGNSGTVYYYNTWAAYWDRHPAVEQNKMYPIDQISLVFPEDGILYINRLTDGINTANPRLKTADFPYDFNYDSIPWNKKDEIRGYNILYGKKWAVCGDSFTDNGYRSSDGESPIIEEDGPYKGYRKVYGYIIGNRNNMTIQHLAAGGRTMATPADGTFSNCFSKDIYKTIASDVDYITLYFGINDSHHEHGSTGSDGEDTSGEIPLGNIDDETVNTFYGAWNVVLPYLIEHYPFAHIGILVSNGVDRDAYRTATIEIANKWGIPYIDLNGDERTPMMIRSSNPAHSSEAKQLRLNAQKVSNSNLHPNATAHEYESYFIENFLRSI